MYGEGRRERREAGGASAVLRLSAATFAVLAVLIAPSVAFAAPANDDFDSAQVVGPALPVSVSGDNTDGTPQSGEPVPPTGVFKSVWYSWTAPNDGPVLLNVCAASPAKEVAVFQGNSVANLIPLFDIDGGAGGCTVSFNATAAGVYRIAVGGFNPGPFTLQMRVRTPPANDKFASPQTIGPNLPIQVDGTTLDATWDNEGGTTAPSVWFLWTPSQSELVEFDFCARTTPPPSTGVLIYTGDTEFTINRVGGSGSCAFTFDAVGGQTYRIKVETDEQVGGPFSLDVDAAHPPANDDFANRERITTLPVSLDRDNIDATGEPEEPDLFGGRSVWFEWTAPRTAEAEIDVCDGEIDPWIGVFIGQSVSSLVTLFADGSNCDVVFDVVAGTSYEIGIGSKEFLDEYSDGAFTFTMDGPNAMPVPPALAPPSPTPAKKSKRCKKKGKRHKSRCHKKHHRSVRS
jgi:hypothetical protein